MVRALLIELVTVARDAVPGCSEAGLSLRTGQGAVGTLACTGPRALALARAEHRGGVGPCISALNGRNGDAPVIADDLATDRRWAGLAPAAAETGLRCIVSLPVPGDGQWRATLNLYADSAGAFAPEALHTATLFAHHAEVVLQQARTLYDERAVHRREQHVAETLQHSLLPALPTISGLACAARYIPSGQSAQVGGDWYDVFTMPDDTVGIAVGDVMGHDMTAAAAMGQLRSVLRSYAYDGMPPATVLDRMNRLVLGFDMTHVATAFYGRLLRANGGALLTYANAGNPPPLLVDPTGQVQVLAQGSSPLIGAPVPDGTPRAVATIAVPVGSTLLLYTDGLVEHRDHDIDEGIEALVRAAVAWTGDELDCLCDHLLAEVVGPAPEDDIALLAVRIEPDGCGEPGR